MQQNLGDMDAGNTEYRLSITSVTLTSNYLLIKDFIVYI